MGILLAGLCCKYSHLSNSLGSWNKRGRDAKVAKSINVEVGINMEGGNMGGGWIFFSKSVSVTSRLLER